MKTQKNSTEPNWKRKLFLGVLLSIVAVLISMFGLVMCSYQLQAEEVDLLFLLCGLAVSFFAVVLSFVALCIILKNSIF